jgi:hypothetical protein
METEVPILCLVINPQDPVSVSFSDSPGDYSKVRFIVPGHIFLELITAGTE